MYQQLIDALDSMDYTLSHVAKNDILQIPYSGTIEIRYLLAQAADVIEHLSQENK